MQTEFYSASTLFTLSGSASAVVVVTGVIGHLLEPMDTGKIKRWLGLIVAIFLSLVGASLAEQRGKIAWLIAFLNGLLIYLTAVGANTILGSTTESTKQYQSPISPVAIERTRFSARQLHSILFQPWWPTRP